MAFARFRKRKPSLQSTLAFGFIGLLLVGVVGALDWFTGPDLDCSLFYLVPVCFVTGYAGQKPGLLTSLVAAIVWLSVDRLTGSRHATQWIMYWNLLTRLTFFSVAVVVLEGWKTSGRRLATMVEHRTLQLRNLATQLVVAEDAERRKLAYDMHDALSQTLSSIKMNLDASVLETADQPATGRRLVQSAELVDHVIQQTRTLMFDLYPSILDDLGLVPAIQWYVRDFEKRTNTPVTVLEQGTPRTLSRVINHYLFRTIKELLGNAVRHGQAKEISVLLFWENQSLRLVVDDDGCGFDTTPKQKNSLAGGIGLLAIRERVSSMGGRLEIESETAHGSRVILEIPILPSNEPEVIHAGPSLIGR